MFLTSIPLYTHLQHIFSSKDWKYLAEVVIWSRNCSAS